MALTGPSVAVSLFELRSFVYFLLVQNSIDAVPIFPQLSTKVATSQQQDSIYLLSFSRYRLSIRCISKEKAVK